MKTLFCMLLLAGLGAAPTTQSIDLGAGRSAKLTLPGTWEPTEAPPRPPGVPDTGATVQYATRDGSNDAVLITVMPVPDDRFSDPEAFRSMAEKSLREFVRGSVEGKAELKECKVGGKVGYACLFTDASLVGKPMIKDDYKTITPCFVYLGDRLMLAATIFSDDPTAETYAVARRILQSLTVTLPRDTI